MTAANIWIQAGWKGVYAPEGRELSPELLRKGRVPSEAFSTLVVHPGNLSVGILLHEV